MLEELIDNYPYNIEAAQKLTMVWSPEIVWDYNTQGYPTGNESAFVWTKEFKPVDYTAGGITVFHVWMRYKIGTKGNWSSPMRINYPTTVKGEKGDDGIGLKGDLGPRGYRGTGLQVQYADANLDVVSYNSTSIIYIRTRLQGGSWTSWLKMIGSDGLGVGGTGMPTGGADTQVIQMMGITPTWVAKTSIYSDALAVTAMGVKGNTNPLHHDRYLNSEAVTAMGVKANSNALNHDRYANTEAQIAVVGSINVLSATLPIIKTLGVYSHSSTNGNRHIPIGGASGNALTTDGSGVYSWVAHLLSTQLDDTKTTTGYVLSASKIISLLGALPRFGIRYTWVDAAARAAQAGMLDDDLGVQLDTRVVYKYGIGTWSSYFTLDIAHNHDTLYYTKAELNTSGGAGQVHWDRITSKPTMLHDDTSSMANLIASNYNVMNAATFDTYGHVLTASRIDLAALQSTLAAADGSLTFSATFKALDTGVNARTVGVAYAGTGGLWGTGVTASRSDHTHNYTNERYVQGNLDNSDDLNNFRYGEGKLPGERSALYRIQGDTLPSHFPSVATLNSGGLTNTINSATAFALKVTVLGDGLAGKWYTKQEIIYKKSTLAYRYYTAFTSAWKDYATDSGWKSTWASATDVQEGTRKCTTISPYTLEGFIYRGRVGGDIVGKTDLNAIIKPGIYEMDSHGTHTLCANAPIAIGSANFRVEVSNSLVSGDSLAKVEQRVWFLGGTQSKPYIRLKSGGAWGAWKIRTDYSSYTQWHDSDYNDATVTLQGLKGHGSWLTPTYAANAVAVDAANCDPLKYRKLTNGNLQITGAFKYTDGAMSTGFHAITTALGTNYQPGVNYHYGQITNLTNNVNSRFVRIGSTGIIEAYLSTVESGHTLYINITIPMA